MKDQLIVKGARQHNLKNIDISLPRDQFIVLTGLSGSGKSSLAFDTIYAEGQRRYVESLSAYARQFLGQMDKPDVDYIEGLSPAISIDQKTTSRNPRSTVGTVTEIYDYLRLLFARVGHAHCPECGKPITQQTIQQMTDDVMSFPEGTKILVLAPMIQGKKGEHKSVFEQLRKEGFVRARVDGVVRTLDEDIVLEKNKKHSIDIVVDRLVVKEGIESRLADSMETASKWAEGIVVIQEVDGPEHMYSQHFACPDCHISLPKIEPRMFSFNSPFGACPACLGIGSTMEVDEERVIPDGSITFADGCVQALSSNPNAWFMRQVEGLLKANGYSLDSTYDELPKALQKKVMYGTTDKVAFTYENMRGEVKEFFTEYEGILPMVKRRHSEASTDSMREEFEKFMSIKPCTTCHGARLKPEVLAITVGDKNINEVTQLTIKEALDFFSMLQLTEREEVIGAQILKEINARLGFLNNVGLDYLTMNRSAGTLSGGEAQRIRLATQIGSGLVGVLYILDEPSIGLHQRDNDRLIDTLKGLRDLGNTLLVVEHDEDTMRAADYLVDIGPGAGEHGGQIIAAGSVDEVMKVKDSITGQYLSGRKFIALPEERRKPGKNCIEIRGAKENNLQNVNVKFPIGLFNVVTGVSGSGKSTFMNILGCLDRPTTGSYRLNGDEVATLSDDELAFVRNKQIGFVFQSFNLLTKLTALENVALPMIYAGMDKKSRNERAAALLSSVGLGDRMDHLPSELSGGQRQRVAIARALANNPAIIMADEPTGNLDSKSTIDVMNIFRGLYEEGRTIILVTHEPEIATYASRNVVLRDGLIVEDSQNLNMTPVQEVPHV